MTDRKNFETFPKLLDRADQLEMVNKIGVAISSLQNLDSILHLIFEQLRSHMPLDVFYVALTDERTGNVSFPLLYDAGKFWHEPTKQISPTSNLGRVLESRQPLLLNRTVHEIEAARQSPNRLGDPTRVVASVIIVPLQADDRFIGGFSIQSYEMNAYGEDHLAVMMDLAHQVTIAIENARLFEEARQTAERFSVINEVSRAIAELKSLPDLLEVVYQQTKKSIDLDFFFVGLYTLETNEIHFPLTYDEGIRYESEPGPVSENSFLARFLRGEKPILINRTADEIASRKMSEARALGNPEKLSASFLVVPLVIGEKVIGEISAQSYRMNAYDESDLDLLVKIANQVAIAIENSRLFVSAQREIEVRQKAEAELRSAEARYRELVELTPTVIFNSEAGSTGRWFYVSPQIETLLGFSAEEWTANPNLWYQQIHPDDREKTIASEADAIAGNSKNSMEYRIFRKDGRQIWVRDESLNISTSEDQKYIVQGTLTDITKRKQAEARLKESEQQYQSLFVTAQRQARELSLLGKVQDAIAHELELSILLNTVVEAIRNAFGYTFVSIYVLDGNILRLQHQVGYDKSNVIEIIPEGKGICGRVSRTGKAVFVENVSETPEFLRADPKISSEICIPLFNGEEIFGVMNVESTQEYRLTSDDLRLLSGLGNQINLAVRRAQLFAERQENLRREIHINEFAHTINRSLELSDLLGTVTRLTAELIAAEAASISMMSEDGMHMADFYNFNDSHELEMLIPKGQGIDWAIYESNKPLLLDDYSEHPVALPTWANSGVHAFMGVPITNGEKRLGVLSVYNRTKTRKFSQRDLSLIEAIAQEVAVAIQNAHLFDTLQKELEERKRIESEREAMYHDLEAKNAELEKFTYTVSHDLKSPLVTIGGFLGFIEEDLDKGDLATAKRSMNRIHAATQKMHRLLDELLELSRVGRLANPSESVPFADLAREAAELVEGQLSERQVEVRVNANLPTVFVDRVRMVEVLQNLMANSIKFMGDQEHPLIEIGSEIEDNHHTFFVKDNGMGIAPEFHEQVFGLFNKLDQSSEGTGIGLALVKRIVEVHGGKIWVESGPGAGATFFFTLADHIPEETS